MPCLLNLAKRVQVKGHTGFLTFFFQHFHRLRQHRHATLAAERRHFEFFLTRDIDTLLTGGPGGTL